MRHTNYLTAIALMVMLVFIGTSCKKDTTTPPAADQDTSLAPMTPYEFITPTYFPEPQPIPADNKLYVERIHLGKMLFYDTRLSNNGESCNSCHLQSKGFIVEGVSTFDNGLTALPLVNLAWYKNFMWNGRIIGSLEDVMMAEVTVRFKTNIDKINAIETYRTLFKKYYGANTITPEHLAKALAQYMRALVSKNTKYERSVRGEARLTIGEELGRQIFFSEKGDCFHCHAAIITTDNALHNNGLDSLYAKDIDKGYFNVTNNPGDLGKFRTPNLRNIALKSDFMHDGRFKALEEVVDFYDHQVHKVSNVDPIMLKTGKENGLKLTDNEKTQLIAFLHTLTDSVMITDTAFHTPW